MPSRAALTPEEYSTTRPLRLLRDEFERFGTSTCGDQTELAKTTAGQSSFAVAEWTQFDRRISDNFAEALFRFWLDVVKPALNPDAVRYMDSLSKQPSSTPS